MSWRRESTPSAAAEPGGLRPGTSGAQSHDRTTPGWLIVRRLLPIVIVVYPMLGWLRYHGEKAGLYGTEVGVALMTGSTLVVLVVGILLTARTLNRADEIRVQAQREAERANRAKSEFLSRMSHELRTPLNSILGFGQLLEMDDGFTPVQRQNLGRIVKAGRHLLEMINEVLDIARIEAGKMSISLEPVDPAQVLYETLELVLPMADERGIAIELNGEMSGRPVAPVLADYQRLKQVLLNLFSNAIKYSREGDRIHAWIEEQGAGRSRIFVRDTGPGISPEDRESLFNPYERLGEQETDVEGTGLGLALSRALVELMGGTIGLESTPGIGSCFFVEFSRAEAAALPRAGYPPKPAGPDRESAVDTGASTVLYIEDNIANLKLVEQILGHRPDLSLISAMQGKIGLELARQHLPDLVLLDLHLPDIPGVEVLEKLKADPDTRQIPVVVVSADATPGQMRRLSKFGASHYLTKPLDVSRFLEVVDSHLGGADQSGSPAKGASHG